MEPMKPMEPMKSMEPMKPMSGGEAWWPQELGQPSTSGGQNGMRYAFFPDARRLVIDTDGKRTTYDTGDHQISGVSQSNGSAPTFSSRQGDVSVKDLRTVD
ncbi:hypothetical protein ASF24_09870 [Methylobacterium sp. Leaf86]|nr:hypothetical protein ASF24_09870 [Methylobacterium sp. Leaf86]